MIGAGSVGFTRRLLMDILAAPEFQDTEFRLMDISA
jgi:alpha-galactosidase